MRLHRSDISGNSFLNSLNEPWLAPVPVGYQLTKLNYARLAAIADYGSSPLLKMTKQILCFNKGLSTFALTQFQFQVTCR